MQQSTKPKVSLFKQKIKKARQAQQKQSQPFPSPLKIDLTQQQKPQSMVNQDSDHHNFVESLLNNSLSQKQLAQIQEENLKKIKQMGKQEIENYQKMIQNQLPKNFLKKVVKNRKIENTKTQNECEMKEQMLEGTQNKFQQENYKSALGSIESLAIDIKTWQLIFLVPQINSSEIVGCENLKLMLGSQNNQTKIIGCKILTNICREILYSRQSKQIGLFRVNGIPFHLGMVIEDICYNLFRALMMSMKQTSFRSCWVQMLASLTQSITLLIEEIDPKFPFLIQLYEFLSNEKQRKRINKIQYPEEINKFRTELEIQQQKNAHFLTQKSLLILIEKLEEKLKEEEKEQEVMRIFEKKDERDKNISLLLQVILLQETQNYYNFTKILDKLKKQIDELDYKQGIRVCYCLCKELKKIHNNNVVNIVVDKMYQIWSKYIKYSIQKQKIYKCEPTIVYEILFCLQFLKRQQFIKNIQQFTKNEKITDDIINTITFLTIDEYHKRPCSAQEVNNIEQMLQFISFHFTKYDPAFTFVSLLSIFQQDQNSYSAIKENILNQTLSNLCLNIEKQKIKQLWQFLTVERVKELIRKYNYNSFGNYCFTRVMLYLMVTCDNNGLQSLIIQQLGQRYPFLFYYASENGLIYGKKQLYEYTNENEQEKEITYKMLCMKEKLNQDNHFVKFLKKNN